jgi:hypothetical protein
MRVAHIVPKQAGLPELKSFRCFVCNEVVTKAVEAERPPQLAAFPVPEKSKSNSES